MSNWYKMALWRNLVDMHIPDWNDEFMTQFDPETYTSLMKKAEIQASEVYAGNCLGICFWPTKVGHMHRGLKGVDIIGPVVGGNREKGIHPIVYYNIWSRWAHDTYPDWRMVSADGRSTIDNGDGTFGRYGVCCMNAPGFREYTKQQLTDLCGSYEMDGLWIDMIGWNGTICHCAHCRKRFKDETGLEIPRVIDWFDPHWVLFQRKREEWYEDYAKLVTSSALAARPGISVTLQCASWQGGWISGVNNGFLAQSDYLAGDFYDDSLGYSVVCKFLNNATKNKPMEFMTSRCGSLIDHTTVKSTRELMETSYAAIANHAAITFIDAIDPVGTMNPALYEKIGSLHKDLKVYLDEISVDAGIMRDVSVYYNFESMIDMRQNGRSLKDSKGGVFAGGSVNLLEQMKNISKTLIGAHFPYDMVSPKSLANAAKDSQVIILPSVYMMDEQEINLLTDFVENGGSLIVTDRTSIMDKHGNAGGDFLLSKLTGVHFMGMTDTDYTYFAPTALGAALLPEYNEKYPMTIDGHSVLVKADGDVDVLATLTLPYSHSGEIFKFGSAISNPPGIKTDYPVLTVRKAGKGRVMYIATALEREVYSAQQDIFAGLIRFMTTKPQMVDLSAPPWLEGILYDDPDKNRYLFYLIASIPIRLDLTAYNVKVKLRAGKKIKRIVDVKTGADLPFAINEGATVFDVAKVDPFAMISILYE